MKKPLLPLFIFIDACGWEIIRRDAFVSQLAPHRHRLRSVFGYSSACVPSILSGRWPADHRNWCYFVYDPANSPFKFLRGLRWLPRAMTSRRIFRRWLSKLVKRKLGFAGYFDLYNIPFEHISLFDFSEKKSPLQPHGMNQGPNIFDFLGDRRIPYHSSDPELSEEQNLQQLRRAVDQQNIDFAFLYWPGLDGLLHQVGNRSPAVPAKLRAYESQLAELVSLAQASYEEVRVYVFSDHGMANCDELLDLKAVVGKLPVRFGKDFVAVYDSTMARFWFFNDEARAMVSAALRGIPQGRILPDEELKSMGTLFDDRHFGELIFLVREGVLIVPSDMGERPITAMHGYHPDDPQSYAALCTNIADLPLSVTDIPHIYDLMTHDAQEAHMANHGQTMPVDAGHLAAHISG